MMRAVLALVAFSLLAGCGLKGGLERPPPMWGDSRAEYDQEQAAEAEAERLRQEREQQQQQNAATPGLVEPSPAQPPESPTAPSNAP